MSLLGTRIRNISAGRQHIVALASNGTLYSWGDNTFYQLGLDKNYLVKAGHCQDGYTQYCEDDVFD